MGRPPIGKVAMTGAERTRLYRLKRGAAAPVTKPVTKPAAPPRLEAMLDLVARMDQFQQADFFDCLVEKYGQDTVIGVRLFSEARIAELESNRDAKAPPFSMSVQQRLDAWKRREMKMMGQSFEQRVHKEVMSRIDEMILPHWKKQIADAQQLYARRRGLMDKATFNKIRRGLHPDSRQSISDQKLGEAFDTLMGLEKFLLDEKDSPTEVGKGLPRSMAEWDEAKKRATAERKAKRAASRSAVRPR